MSNQPRLPALDGVRALAVLAVLANHAGIPGMGGGFVGVDIFFVLSGFLITSLLLDESDRSGKLDLPAFWSRRARRLLPAALVMITVVVAGRTLLRPDAIHALRADALSAALWSSNWHFALQGTDYFAQGGTASPLQHTWSLAVEEQFYLLWPCLLGLIWFGATTAAQRRGRLLLVAVSGAALSAAITTALAGHGQPGRVYFGTDTRAQELLIGAATAALLAPTWRWHTTAHRARRSPQALARHGIPLLLGAAGLVILCYAANTATGAPDEFHRGLMVWVSLASAALIGGLVLDGRMVVSRWLSSAPLVAIGRLSYGIYLWHWPVFEVLTAARTGLHSWPLAGARVATAIGLALVSYELIERPARAARLRPARLLPVAAAGVAATIVATVVLSPAGTAQLAGAAELDAPPAGAHRIAATSTAKATGGALIAARRHHGLPITVDVFGDSIPWTLAQYWPASTQVNLTNHAQLGCGIANDGPYRYFGQRYDTNQACLNWQTSWPAQVNADHPDEVLLMVGRWETMDREFNGTWTHLGDPQFDDYLSAQLDTAINALTATGVQLIVANEPYNERGEQPDGSLYPEDDPARVDAWNKIVAARVAAHHGVTLVDMNHELCPDGRYTWNVDGVRVRSDGVHLSPNGVAWIQPWLTDQLLNAA